MRYAVSTVLVGVIAMLAWIYQTAIADTWRSWAVTRPYAAAHVLPYVLTTAAEHALKAGNSFKECAQDCPEMVVVPAGSFLMGGSQANEKPQHPVTFAKPFAVAKHQLTFADWDACVNGGGCNGYSPRDQGWGRGRQPAINVDWNDAQAYVQWLATVTGKRYRLLSEAEYEYATRAGTTTEYPWGDEITLNGKARANCNGCGSQWDNKQPAPVGSFLPNELGSMTWSAMSRSWSRIATIPLTKMRRAMEGLGPRATTNAASNPPAAFASSGAGPGTNDQSSFAPRRATAAPPTPAATVSDFASREHSRDLEPFSTPTPTVSSAVASSPAAAAAKRAADHSQSLPRTTNSEQEDKLTLMVCSARGNGVPPPGDRTENGSP